MESPIIIVGAGQAGLQLAESLRNEGWTGPIQLIGDEHHAPYHRPPLSKQYLTGESIEAQLTIRGPEFLARKDIDLRTGVTVQTIDRAAKSVLFSDGQSRLYHAIGLTTGARARALPVPGAGLDGVLTLRGLDDANRIAARLPHTSRLVVVGGGFIGLEIAAAARTFGVDVTVLEAAPRLMARVVSPLLSRFYADLHARHGVRILCNAQVTGLVGADGRITGVTTAEGVIPADLVVVGIGVIANDDLARASGLDCDRGIIVDACSRTSDPSIVAAGDCTARLMPDGGLRRLESVQNAVEQAKSAAAALMGRERPFLATPWFWSDQFNCKLQMVGQSAGYDHAAVRGVVAEGHFSVFYYAGDRLIGVDSLDGPREHMAARGLLDKGLSPGPAQVTDPDFDLTAAMRAG